MEHRTARVPDLGEPRRTLLAAPRARAAQSPVLRGVRRDLRTVEPADALDDTGRLEGARGEIGSNVRTLLFDTWVHDFLTQHPTGTVVDIGSGLATRFQRLDNGTVNWFDLTPAATLRTDLHDQASKRRSTLTTSVTDSSWIDDVRQSPGPYFVAAEAALMSLDEDDVRRVIRMIVERLPGAYLALDTASSWLVDNQDGHDVLGKVTARLRWRCDDPTRVAQWHPGLTLTQSCTFARLPAAVSRRISQPQRGMLRAMAAVMRRQIQDYRFNLYQLGTP
ncbi:class I SAM-dependent methyltransferase [Streptomyces sp. NPDC056500]|uniref:class I SAM-dependent methyltransferase n=1 Tax=Streptomyces sp. NPDC056500 TaxID=3345840 RepID=UPI0036939E51